MELEVQHTPGPRTHPHHRKIELQSTHDLTHLQSQLLAAARQKLDLNLPPASQQRARQPATYIPLGTTQRPAPQPALQQEEEIEEEDPLRLRVSSLLTSFLSETWKGACQNITVNGIDASSLPSHTIVSDPNHSLNKEGETDTETEIEGIHYTYTPYDPRLQSKVSSLYAELESLTAQVSKLRREAPKAGAEHYASSLKAQLEDDDARYEASVQRLHDEAQGPESLDLGASGLREGWHGDVQAMYERGVEELARLTGVRSRHHDDADGGGRNKGGSLTEAVGKVQRAVDVARELE